MTPGPLRDRAYCEWLKARRQHAKAVADGATLVLVLVGLMMLGLVLAVLSLVVPGEWARWLLLPIWRVLP